MKLGFIGCGNMALAIANGVTKSQLFPLETIAATDIQTEARRRFESITNIQTFDTIETILHAEFIILAIKPQQFKDFLTTHAGKIAPTSTLISIAAGKNIAWIETFFQNNQPIIRIMPNLNATIGTSVTAVTKNTHVNAEQFTVAADIIQSFGTLHFLDESQFSTFTAIAGSSPAYFFKMIDAMARSASNNGIDYEVAKRIVIETMIGSADFAQTTKTALPTLIQNVASPNGTTEAALKILDAHQFDSLIDTAQSACIQRDIELQSE